MARILERTIDDYGCVTIHGKQWFVSADGELIRRRVRIHGGSGESFVAEIGNGVFVPLQDQPKSTMLKVGVATSGREGEQYLIPGAGLPEFISHEAQELQKIGRYFHDADAEEFEIFRMLMDSENISLWDAIKMCIENPDPDMDWMDRDES